MAFVAYQQAHLQNAKCLPAVLGETETVNSQTHISSALWAEKYTLNRSHSIEVSK